MHAILFGLGIATSAVGFIAIGFGIPVSSFSFGNTLIISGTIAVVGGFILIALSSAVGHLRRIAEGDAMHAPAMPIHPAETYQPRAQPPLPSSAMSPMKPEPAPRVQAPLEPALAASPLAEPDLAWLRPKSATPSFGEQALIEEMEASLSPGSPAPPPSAPRLVSPAPSAPPSQPAQIGRLNEPEVQPPSRAEPSARSAPAVEHPNPSGLFDTVWPEIRPARNAETVARARKPDGTAPQREDSKSKDANPQAPPSDDQPPAILKSGMIDGMAYTLYADGSIEAVLATGPIRFASIDALRLHLEKNG